MNKEVKEWFSRGWHEMSAVHAWMTARVLETVYGVNTWLEQSLGCGESLTHLSKKQLPEECESIYLMLSFVRTDQVGRQKKF